MSDDAPKRKASGVNIPETQRHTVRIYLRVPPEIAERLDELAEQWNVTRSGVLGMLVEEHDAQHGVE